ncbi:hypothetical protein JQ634_06130 [Bradyrhizobium sp. AUGA SZCCT0240]|uniref:hypothetical protein n=1 Tax=unclassified Bradyrhizobium TaxID=2631580 RepID=UPI001BAAB9D3|nr:MULTISPECIES: hypothetical protein [unclassified Bradyrhizobium]MBR1198087.1 hypothetical protein [Bradyrhizobium sp. AUGA SZCCT0158]MBR1243456.1 hypothetical protein [Bradyrhizobium sp. AUGA SZCCT0274]MBR1253275.1 hypothetical protein [Bradyrhizobium sp. AUGA SZCCT0240]
MPQPNIGLLAVLLLIPTSISAQQLTRQQQIDQAKALIQESCLSGNSYSFDASADGHIQIKSLKPNLKAGISLNAKTAPGGVGYVQEEIRKNVDDAIRKCMEPYIGRILDLIIGAPSKSSSRDEMTRAVAAVEGRIVNISFDTVPNDLTKVVGKIEFDIFESDFSDARTGRGYNAYGSEIKLGTFETVRQFGFLRGRLSGMRYAQSSTESGPDVKCSTPLLQSWSDLKDEFGIARGDISGSGVDNGNNDVMLRHTNDQFETSSLIMSFSMSESTDMLKKKRKSSKSCIVSVAMETK